MDLEPTTLDDVLAEAEGVSLPEDNDSPSEEQATETASRVANTFIDHPEGSGIYYSLPFGD